MNGASRRRFLKGLSIATLAAIAPLPSLGSVRSNRYTSRIFGVSFQFPESWCELLPEHYVDLYNATIHDDFIKELEVPLAMVTENKEPTLDINPNFEIRLHDYEKYEDDSIAKIVEEDIYYWGLENLEILSPIKSTRLSGKEAAYVEYQFTELLKHDAEIKWYVKSYLIEHKGYLARISFKGRDSDHIRLSSEFQLIHDTFEFLDTNA